MTCVQEKKVYTIKMIKLPDKNKAYYHRMLYWNLPTSIDL